MTGDTESALVPRAVNGDSTALNELFVRCIPQLQRTAARFLSNPQDSEDALQDGLLSGVRYVSKFQGLARFSTWMHTIVANSAKSTLRRKRRWPITFSLDDPHPDYETLSLGEMIRDPHSGLEQRYQHAERLHVLANVVRKLPPIHRSIICVCDVEGLCMREAANRLGLSVPAAKTRHLRAMRFLSRIARTAHERRVPVLKILEEQVTLLATQAKKRGQSRAVKVSPAGGKRPNSRGFAVR
jgi:RNA polymerase sigma factor (sigma-70 family)